MAAVRQRCSPIHITEVSLQRDLSDERGSDRGGGGGSPPTETWLLEIALMPMLYALYRPLTTKWVDLGNPQQLILIVIGKFLDLSFAAGVDFDPKGVMEEGREGGQEGCGSIER